MTAPKPNARVYMAHGYVALKRALECVMDFDQWLEKQGEAAKPLRLLRSQMIANQGGEHVITASERIAIDATLKTYLYLFLIDDFVLMEQGTPVNRRDRRLFNVVLQRGPIYEAVMKAGPILNDLRKNRAKKEPVALADYLSMPTHTMPNIGTTEATPALIPPSAGPAYVHTPAQPSSLGGVAPVQSMSTPSATVADLHTGEAEVTNDAETTLTSPSPQPSQGEHHAEHA